MALAQPGSLTYSQGVGSQPYFYHHNPHARTTGPDGKSSAPSYPGPDFPGYSKAGSDGDHAKGWEAYFGPPNLGPRDRGSGMFGGADPGYNESIKTYESGFSGRRLYLEVIIITYLAWARQEPIRRLLPWTENSDFISVEWDVWKFNDHVLQNEPPLHVPRLVTSKMSSNRAQLLRHGIGLALEFDFWKTPTGKMAFRCHILQIINAVVFTFCLNVMLALLNPAYNNLEEDQRFNTFRSVVAMKQFVQREIDNWACFQKDPLSIPRLIEESSETMMQRIGRQGNCLVVPAKTIMYVQNHPALRDFIYTGGTGPDASTEGMFSQKGERLSIFQSRAWPQGLGVPPLDPVWSPRITSSFFLMGTSHLKHIIADSAHADSKSPSPFKSSMLDVAIYAEEADNWARIRYWDALKNSGIFDTNGDLSTIGQAVVSDGKGNTHGVEQWMEEYKLKEHYKRRVFASPESLARFVIAALNAVDDVRAESEAFKSGLGIMVLSGASEGVMSVRKFGRARDAMRVALEAKSGADVRTIPVDEPHRLLLEAIGKQKPAELTYDMLLLVSRSVFETKSKPAALTGEEESKEEKDAKQALDEAKTAEEAARRALPPRAKRAAHGGSGAEAAPEAKSAEQSAYETATRARAAAETKYNTSKTNAMRSRLTAPGALAAVPGIDSIFDTLISSVSWTEGFCKWAHDENMPPLFDLVCFRQATYMMGTGIYMCGDGQAGYLFHSTHNFMMSINTSTQLVTGHYSLWAKAVITNAMAIIHWRNCVVREYLGGNNADFWNPLSPDDTQNYHANNGTKSIFVCAVPPGSMDSRDRQWIDMTGQCHQDLQLDADEPEALHYPSAPDYARVWQWGHSLTHSMNAQPFDDSPSIVNATLAFRDMYWRYGSNCRMGSGIDDLNSYVLSSGHWGSDMIYPGCGRARRLAGHYFDKKDWTGSSTKRIVATH